jgi:hypothetical protein
MEYNLIKPWKTLDPWQQEVLETKGDIVLRSGRQVGKSTVISIKAGEYAVQNSKKEIMIIASVERQAHHLFRKVISYLNENHKGAIKGRPTLTFVELKNGSIIRCLPAGMDGEGIRGFTIDLLIADEAAFISEMVWSAVTPMLAVTRGKKILLSTPHGRSGYFFECFEDEDYKSFHITSEECPRKDDKFLAKERKRMSTAQYAQEYLGEFVDDFRQYFSDDLIRAICILRRRDQFLKGQKYYMGIDIGGMGKDETTFEILDATSGKRIEQVDSITTKKTRQPDTYNKIKELDSIYRFNRKSIGIDNQGIGIGVFEWLLRDKEMNRKVVGLNNSRKSVERGSQRVNRVMKEDFYENLLNMMERRNIKLLKDEELMASLKSVQVERDDGKVRFFGKSTHITEGLIRAAWCAKEKSLSIMPFC